MSYKTDHEYCESQLKHVQNNNFYGMVLMTIGLLLLTLGWICERRNCQQLNQEKEVLAQELNIRKGVK